MYQGKFKLKNPSKYKGDYNNVIYRSSWELSVMMWCDNNSFITEWSSEELVIPYLCPTDNSFHRYFVDFTIRFSNGKSYWIELKPEKYTIPPNKPKRANKRFITETLQYVKNQAKWKAAEEYAKKHNSTFSVWTENTLSKLGIKILGK
ncbi:head completion protein [uncultured Caudovirales phage]|uniref:Head completion nuclease n=1 Tax=uncultured Caudovirales phage TaxID=2100421 RepID=A0A6J5M819_9CAUD|nr:head completion protein [uncultured Caudovirales phage]